MEPAQLERQVVRDGDPGRPSFTVDHGATWTGRVIPQTVNVAAMLFDIQLPADESMEVVLYATHEEVPTKIRSLRGRGPGEPEAFAKSVEVLRVPVGPDLAFRTPRVAAARVWFAVEGAYVTGRIDADPASLSDLTSEGVQIEATIGAHVTFDLMLPADANDEQRRALIGRRLVLTGRHKPGGKDKTETTVWLAAEIEEAPGGAVDHGGTGSLRAVSRGVSATLFSAGRYAGQLRGIDKSAADLFPFRVPAAFSFFGEPAQRIQRTIALEHGLVVQGRVIDPSGAPIEGAHVTFSDAAGATPRSSAEFMATGPDGRFRVPSVSHGVDSMAVSSKGHARFEAHGTELDALLEAPSVEVILEPTRGDLSIQVQARYPNGTPAADLSIFVVEADANSEPLLVSRPIEATTDEAGVAHIKGLLRRRYLLVGAISMPATDQAARRDRSNYQLVALVEPAQLEAQGVHEFVLERARQLEVELNWGDAGQEGHATVIAERIRGRAERLPDPWNHGSKGMTAAQKTASLELFPGEYMVRGHVWADNAQQLTTEPVRVDVTGGDAYIVLERANWPAVRGRVIDELGEAVAGANIWSSQDGDVGGYSRRRSAVSAADGTFSLGRLPEGRYLAEIHAANHGIVRPLPFEVLAGGTHDIVLEVLRGGSVELKVLGVAAERGTQWGFGIMNREVNGRIPKARTGDRGVARIDGIAPGRVMLTVGLPDPSREERFISHWRAVDVIAGETTRVTIDARTAATSTCRGRITCKGVVAARMRIQVAQNGVSLGTTTTNHAGHFDLHIGIDGSATLEVCSEDGDVIVQRRVDFRAGQDTVCDIELPSACVEGVVLGELTWEHSAYLAVMLRSADAPDGPALRTTTAVGRRRFRFDHLPDGRYALTANGAFDQAAEVRRGGIKPKTFEVKNGRAPERIEVHLEKHQ